MSRLVTIALVLIAVVSGLALFQLKHIVQAKDAELAALYEQMAEDREALRVLNVEWDYRTRPHHLQALAAEKLELAPTQPAQILASLAELPYRPVTFEAAPESGEGRQ